MSETKQRYAKKNLIHLSKEQEEKLAAQSHAKVQAFVNELNLVQSRRFELASALLIAKAGRDNVGPEDVEACRALASEMVDADAKQKWSDLKAVFVDLNVQAPQPPLEFAAAKVGVTLFDVLPEEPAPLIINPSTEDMDALTKVVQ